MDARGFPGPLRSIIWRGWYEYVAQLLGEASYEFLNFGYLPPSQNGSVQLAPADEENRPFIELYHRVAGASDLRCKSVLEVSCGRGGGARYIHRYLEPARLLAVDRSARLIQYCRESYQGDGIEFLQADAEALQLPVASFDAVVNVEASHAYGNRERFFHGVYRLLTPGGVLLTADFCPVASLPRWRQELAEAGFYVKEEEDLTEGVLRALRATNEIRLRAIREHAPRVLYPLFLNFAGAHGSRVERGLQAGSYAYVRFVVVKPGG